MDYTPVQARDNQGALIPFSFANVQMRISKAGLNSAVYVGYARNNISANDPGWLITKQEYDSAGDIVHVKHAIKGLSQRAYYDQVWDNSTAIAISSITKAAIAVVTTTAAHGLTTGDLIEIVGSDMKEVNGNGYGLVMFTVKVTAPTTFTLVNPATGDDVNSSAFVDVATTGNAFKRTYGTLNYA